MTDNLPPRGPWTALACLLVLVGLTVLTVVVFIIVLLIEGITS